MVINNSIFSNNQALYYSNCIVFYGKDLQLLNSNFTNNSNIKSVLYNSYQNNIGVGGALFIAGINTYINNCHFNINSNKLGGVFTFSLNIIALKNIVYIENSVFSQNKGDLFAGVIYFMPGLNIFNCTIIKNLFIENSSQKSFILF